jgi:hypothetical protein
VVPLGEPIDGAANVRELLKGLLEGFPGFHAAIDRMHHSESVVSVELRMLGTHRGPSAGIPRPAAASTFPPRASSNSTATSSNARRSILTWPR